jgi:hypothetical protein
MLRTVSTLSQQDNWPSSSLQNNSNLLVQKFFFPQNCQKSIETA